jgi:hypothetical protein
MKKFNVYKIMFICLGMGILSIGCSKKNQNEKTDSPVNTEEVKEEESNQPETEDDIEIVNKCDSLTAEKANAIAKEIKEIIVDTQNGVYKIENFTMEFNNEKIEDSNIIIDITAESDWTTIRKPEDYPVIMGMNEAVEELDTEEEKEKAKVIISGYVANMEAENTKERIPEYLKVKFENKDDMNYELLFPEVLDGKTTLYPMKEYFDEHYKENWEEKKELGRETLLRDLE